MSFDDGTILQNNRPAYLRNVIKAMLHVGHHEITLVSPFFSPSIFSRHHYFGKFLDKSIEEGTIIGFVTLPPSQDQLKFFEELAAREIFVYFHKSLHTKLFLFSINRTTLNKYNKNEICDTAILGSANLTESGIGFDDGPFNEELCYQLPQYKFTECRQYTTWLINQSIDFESYRYIQRRI